MKIIQSLGFYFPDSTGGTEVYVEGLVKQLHQQNPQTENIIIAPGGNEEKTYNHNGIKVYRYPVFSDLDIGQIRGDKPPGGFEYFTNFLIQEKPDIYHQHSWTTGCGFHHLKTAKELGIKTLITVHVPGNVCLRGTMLLNDETVCDGKIDLVRCSQCWGKSRKIPPLINQLASQMPTEISDFLLSSLPNNRLTTILGTKALVKKHQQRLLEYNNYADKIIAVCQWLYDALLINDIPKEKLVLCRQGVSENTSSLTPPFLKVNREDNKLIIGFLGRWDKIKGIHIIVEAVKNLPAHIPVELLIHAVGNGLEVETYQKQVFKIANNDPRIKFLPPLSRDEILSKIANFDLLAVPSQCLETGPLVVLEAQAMGTPILGSNLGGIAELVKHNINGLLVPHQDVKAWQDAVLMLAKNRQLLYNMRQEVKSVRTMKDVALEMSKIYQEFIQL
jgi:glycosyltransferase involved in cell wall biosynthesis